MGQSSRRGPQVWKVGLLLALLLANTWIWVRATRHERPREMSRSRQARQTRSEQDWQLVVAAREGNIEAVRKLLTAGANVNSPDRCGETALHDAASAGYQDIVELLLTAETNTVVSTENIDKALYLAAGAGHLDIVETLLAHGARVNDKERYTETPLHQAAHGGHIEVVECLIEHGADVNDTYGARNYTPLFAALSGWDMEAEVRREMARLLVNRSVVNLRNLHAYERPLHLAARRGDPNIVALLIEHGARIDPKDENGRTPLMTAILAYNPEIVDLLIAHGADVSAKGRRVGTPLHYAVTNGGPAITERLIQSGADVNAIDNAGDTPAAAAMKAGRRNMVRLLADHGATLSIHEAAYIGDVGRVRTLLDNGTNPDLPDPNSRTPLYVASDEGYLDVVQLLVERGANVNTPRTGGRTPLHVAANSGHLDVVEELLAVGADVNVVDDVGCTPLHEAASGGHLAVVERLVAEGVSVNATTKRGSRADVYGRTYWGSQQTPLDVTGEGHQDIARFLIAHGAEATIDQAIRAGALEKTRSLVETGIDVTAMRHEGVGITLLHAAARYGHKDIIELLLACGADVNANPRTVQNSDEFTAGGETPLHKAVFRRHLDAAETLIAHGADVNCKTSRGESPLHMAAASGDAGIAGLLLESHADVDAANGGGQTPLYIASRHGQTALVELLMAHGADPNAKTLRGTSPLDAARVAGFADTVAALGGDGRDPALAEKGPTSIIVRDRQSTHDFLRFYGIDFDEIWDPNAADIKGLTAVLDSCLRDHTPVKTRFLWGEEDILANLRLYSRWYSGIVRDGKKYIVCAMYLDDSFERPPHEQFPIVFDGGWAVVKVVFDPQQRTVVYIECNGN